MASSVSKKPVKIENLVFGGGGAMGVAYGGVMKVLDEAKILPNVKRFAGTSVGAIGAAVFAMNCSVQNFEQILNTNMEYVLKDYCCGMCSCNDSCACTCCCSCCQSCMGRINTCFLTFCGLCNLLCRACSCRDPPFGMYTGNKFYKWVGAQFENLGFPKNVTFKELYEKNGNELCIAVTNISTKFEEFCHVKTTPDMEIRQAVRMSMSIPVVFEDVRLMNASSGRPAVYVDGGMLCNYPIFCFDGWWLSMKPEHSFFKKLKDVETMPEIYASRFKPENDEDLLKTLGFVLFGDKESQLYRRHCREEEKIHNLCAAVTEQPPKLDIPESDTVDGLSEESSVTEQPPRLDIPETDTIDRVFRNIRTRLKIKFLTLNKATSDCEYKNLRIFLEFVAAAEKEEKLEMTDFISELEKLKCLRAEVFEDLFGDRNPTGVWTYLTQRKGGKMEFSDISRFITRHTDHSIDQWYSGFSYKPSGTTTEFLGSLLTTMILNSSRIYMKDTDIPRTVGINTKYITALDFDMEEDDKKLLVQCGRDATIEFLKDRGYKF